MTIELSSSPSAGDLKQVLDSVSKQLRELGYDPHSLIHLGAVAWLSYATAMIDRNPHRSDMPELLADLFRGICGNVIQGIYDYRNEKRDNSADPVADTGSRP